MAVAAKVYIPEFESQRDQSAPLPWTNCQPASGAMMLDHWTYGRVNTDDITLRRLSGIPVTRGMNFRELAAAIEKHSPHLGRLLYSEKDGSGTDQITWAELRDNVLAKGGAAIVCGNYASLADNKTIDGKAITRWQPGGSFGHAMLVCDYRPTEDKSVLLFDPLGHSGYDGDRIPLTALWEFIWRNGNGPDAVVTAAHRFSIARPAPIAPSTRVDLAGTISAFGTRYPVYVHSYKEALEWVNRNIRRYRESQNPLPKL